MFESLDNSVNNVIDFKIFEVDNYIVADYQLF